MAFSQSLLILKGFIHKTLAIPILNPCFSNSILAFFASNLVIEIGNKIKSKLSEIKSGSSSLLSLGSELCLGYVITVLHSFYIL